LILVNGSTEKLEATLFVLGFFFEGRRMILVNSFFHLLFIIFQRKNLLFPVLLPPPPRVHKKNSFMEFLSTNGLWSLVIFDPTGLDPIGERFTSLAPVIGLNVGEQLMISCFLLNIEVGGDKK